MKSIFAFLLILIGLTGCADDKQTSPQRVPSAPSDLIGRTLSQSAIQLYWADNSDNETNFIVYRSQDQPWYQIGTTQSNQTSFTDSLLLDSTTYLYFVLAHNAVGNSITSDTISVTTSGIGLPPTTPSDPFPVDLDTVYEANIELRWHSTDPDNDTLMYDVYFGINGNLSLVGQNILDTVFNPGAIGRGTNYYWRIVAKDRNHHEIPGPIWRFRVIGGLYYLDFYDPNRPVRKIFYKDNYLYLAEDYRGFQVLNVSDPGVLSLVGSYATPDTVRDIFVLNDYAYVADGRFMRIYDVSDKSNPVEVGSHETGTPVWAIQVVNDYAYISDSYTGLLIVNISNPSHPAYVGFYNTVGVSVDQSIQDQYAYVADGTDGGLQIINISDPSNPTLTGHYATEGNAIALFTLGNYAYVCDYEFGIDIVSVVSPSSPYLIHSIPVSDHAWDVYVDNNLIYIAGGLSGLKVVTSSPNYSIVGTFDTAGYLVNVKVTERYIFLADWNNGITILRFN